MLQIYFDGQLVDSNMYMELVQNWKMFDKEFRLGATPCRQFDLTIPYSHFDKNVNKILIKINGEEYAHLILDKYKINKGGFVHTVKMTLTDKMVTLNKKYNAKDIVPTTIKGILLDICSKFGLELGNTSFVNDDVPVDFYNGDVNARDYVSYIAECSGGFARIEEDGKLWIRYFNNENHKIINKYVCEKIEVEEKHKIERVVFDNGLLKFETSQDEDKETLYLNSANVYINSLETFNKLKTKIINFEYTNIDTGQTIIMNESKTGDIYKIDDLYSIIENKRLTYMGSAWHGGYKLNLQSKKHSETKVVGSKSQIKDIQVKLDRVNNEVEIAVTKTEEVTKQVEKVKEEVDKIDIDGKADKSEVYTRTQLDTKFTQTDEKITQEVSRVETQISGVDEKTETNKSKIEQTADEIKLTINEDKNEINARIDNAISSMESITQDLDKIKINDQAIKELNETFGIYGDELASYKTGVSDKIQSLLDAIDEKAMGKENKQNLEQAFSFTTRGLEITSKDSSIRLVITNDSLDFYDGSRKVAYMSGQRLYITSGVFVDNIIIGNHRFEKQGDILTNVQYIGKG